MTRLDRPAVERWLARSPQWRHDPARDAISRDYRFASFADAFGFMTALAIRADARNHHPEWSNVYDRVRVTWTTHDVDGLSALDLEMAELSDAAYARFAAD